MIPWLEFDPPFCAGCDERTEVDDDGDLRCEHCRIEWRHDGCDGRLDDDVVRCGEGSDLFVSTTSIPICVRPAGHGGYMLDGMQYRQHAGYAPHHPDMTWSTWTTQEVPA